MPRLHTLSGLPLGFRGPNCSLLGGLTHGVIWNPHCSLSTAVPFSPRPLGEDQKARRPCKQQLRCMAVGWRSDRPGNKRAAIITLAGGGRGERSLDGSSRKEKPGRDPRAEGGVDAGCSAPVLLRQARRLRPSSHEALLCLMRVWFLPLSSTPLLFSYLGCAAERFHQKCRQSKDP